MLTRSKKNTLDHHVTAEDTLECSSKKKASKRKTKLNKYELSSDNEMQIELDNDSDYEFSEELLDKSIDKSDFKEGNKENRENHQFLPQSQRRVSC